MHFSSEQNWICNLRRQQTRFSLFRFLATAEEPYFCFFSYLCTTYYQAYKQEENPYISFCARDWTRDEAFCLCVSFGHSDPSGVFPCHRGSKGWFRQNQRHPLHAEWIPLLCKWLQRLLVNVHSFRPISEVQGFKCLPRSSKSRPYRC